MSTSATPSSSLPTLSFNGSSTYSSSFQQVLTRAVDLASLPMQQVQNDVTTLQSKQSALTSLGTTMMALQTAVSNISESVSGSPQATSSNSSAVSASATSSALTGTYQIQVDNLGSNTTTLSNTGLTTVSDPTSQNISSSTSYSLTVNGTSFNITSSGATLDDLVTAINGANDGVQATIVNVGSNTSPDYRLSVTSDNLAPDTVQLNDGTKNLLTTLSTGSNAEYQVNGQTTQIGSNSNTVTLSPGLTVSLNQTTTSPVVISVAQSNSGLSSALSSFASAYNAAVAAVGQQRGQSGGALVGDSLVFQLGGVLNNIVDYTSSSGSVGSLADLGLTLNSDGTLTFDSSTFASANSADIQSFLGSTTTSGLLETAFHSLDSFTNTVTGSIGSEYNTFGTEITADNTKIANDQAQISVMQSNLQAQLSAADAAIATLQSQTNYFEQLFTATYGSPNPSVGG
jgi:flagellar hook-associated protein 2